MPKPVKKKSTTPTAIEFDQARYEALVRALHIAGTVYGLLGDLVDEGTGTSASAGAGTDTDERYKKQSEAMDDLVSWVLANAGAFGMAGDVEIFDGSAGLAADGGAMLNVLTDTAMDRYADDIEEYEEFVFWDVLAHKLTDRELARRRARGELRGMGEQEIARMHDELEEAFSEKLVRHGLDLLELPKMPEIKEGE